MTPEDLARIHAACFPGQRAWSADEFADLLSLPGTFLITRPHGYALGRAAAGEAELLILAVTPEARRQGLGRQLLAAFEAAAKERKASELFLEVAADNRGALALYRAGGWAEHGRRRKYYTRRSGPEIDAVLMRKALP